MDGVSLDGTALMLASVLTAFRPPQDSTRNSIKTTERAKNHDSNNLLDQVNRRPQHMPRKSASMYST